MLKEYKPYLFVVFPERDNNGRIDELAVYRVRLIEYDSTKKAWVYESEKERNNPRDAPAYERDYMRLEAPLYNKMGTDGGWRFEEHNYFLLPSNDKPFKCSKTHNHYAMLAPDTKPVNYHRLLNDPSYDITALLKVPFDKGIQLRNAFNVYRDGRPTGGLQVQTGTILSTTKRDKFLVRFAQDDAPVQLDLRPDKYGKVLREIDGWEFVDFNYVFNLQLQVNLNELN